MEEHYDYEYEPVAFPGSSTDGGAALEKRESSEKSKKMSSSSSRAPRACDVCRRRKIKCTGGSPEAPCENCRNAKISCTFLDTKSTKRQPPKGYVESLERRIEYMESLLRAQQTGSQTPPDNAMNGSSLDSQAQKKDYFEDDCCQIAASGASPESLENLDVLEMLANDLEELSVDKDRYIGRGSGLHLARSIEAYSTHPDNPASKNTKDVNMATDTSPSLVENLLQNEQRMRSLEMRLPPPDLLDRLIESFFVFNSTFALLHRPSFDRARVAGLLETDMSFRGLVFMMLAIASRFVEDDRIFMPMSDTKPQGAQQSRGFDFFKSGSNSGSLSLSSSTLYDLQSSALSIIWLCGAASPISAWAAVGFSIRRAVDVGAHREVRSRWSRSPLDDQLRKRAFFALYGLDRILSSILGRPIAIHDDDIDLKLPLDISDEALDDWNVKGLVAGIPPAPSIPTEISGTVCLYRLQHIMGKAFSTIFLTRNRRGNADSVAELDSLLNEWLASIPEHLRWNPDQKNLQWLTQSAALYSSYYCTQILIHRDYISPSTALGAFPSLAICTNAARSTSHVLSLLQEKGQLESLFFLVPMQLTTAVLILLLSVISSGSLTSSATADISKCLGALQQLGKRTFIASKCCVGVGKFQQATLPPDNIVVPPVAGASKDPMNRKRSMETEQGEDGTSPSSSSGTTSSRSGAEFSTYSSETTAESASSSGPRTSRTKALSTSNRRFRPPPAKLPTSTSDLSLLTFRGYDTFLPPSQSSQAAQTSAPTTANDTLATLPLLSPSTAAMLQNTTTSYQSDQPFNFGGTFSPTPAFGGNASFPFSFDMGYGSGAATDPLGNGMDDWAAGFDFNAFTQSFVQ